MNDKTKSITEIIEETKEVMCDQYCKYADTWKNNESDEWPEECNNCPLNNL